MNASTNPSRRHKGLTLLEVLAAAMIFSMVMTVLIGTSSTAVHNMGMSARRLEANLVADALLADLEVQMKQGVAPKIDESEWIQDQYSISMFRTDLIADSGAATPGALPDIGGAATEIAAMLGAGLPEVTKHLKQYDIEVSWLEQDGPQNVMRTTFAFDWQTAALEFSGLFARGNAGTSNSGNGDDEGGGGGVPGDKFTVEQKRAFFENVTRSRGRLRDGHNARNNALGLAPGSERVRR